MISAIGQEDESVIQGLTPQEKIHDIEILRCIAYVSDPADDSLASNFCRLPIIQLPPTNLHRAFNNHRKLLQMSETCTEI